MAGVIHSFNCALEVQILAPKEILSSGAHLVRLRKKSKEMRRRLLQSGETCESREREETKAWATRLRVAPRTSDSAGER